MDTLFPKTFDIWFIIAGLGRITVPSFFMINGYYFCKKINDNKAIKKYLIHLLIIYTTWFIIYLRPFLMKGDKMFVLYDFRIDLILEYYIFGYYHIWYVPALIMGVILLVLLKRTVKKDYILLLIGLVLYISGYFIELMEGPLFYARNGLFIGYPFILLGYYIHTTDFDKKIKSSYLAVLIFITLMTLTIELSYTFERAFYRNIYLSLPILCPCIFLFIMKHSVYKEKSTFLNYLGSMPSAIYFVHFYVIFKSFAITDLAPVSRFLLVILVSVLASIIIIFVNKRIKIFL